ncbi:WhiB family transcriptional regulator [Streptomyces sp. NPDC052101]|uniref:WhiB family transcriptional regulator n=1 Tax=Streptomyces sp. NPDC052101 TaxID=3155763 RepID=UPI00341389B7
MRLARPTTLPALPTPRARERHRGPYIPDAALPCRRRPDVFQHPLLENAPDTAGVPGSPPEQRRQHLVLLRTASDLCASCPLWAECLQDAVAYAEPYGYAAATTPEDRRRMRRALGVGDASGDLPTRVADGAEDQARRLARVRSRTAETILHRAGGHGLPTLEQILDAFDLLQDAPPRGPEEPGHPSADPAQPAHERTRTPRAERPGPPGHTESGNEHMAAAGGGQRIAFSYEDPAQAVRQALLGPLVRTTLPALASLEQFVAMLVCLPGSEVSPETLGEVQAVRAAVASLVPEEDGDHTAARPRPLSGSISVELATKDPVAALRHDVLHPLLRELAVGLGNIEKVATMLAATADGDDSLLTTIRSALHKLRAHLPHPAPVDEPVGRGTGTAAPEPRRRPPTAPSIRAAVERAVEAFPGPFSARDVRRALPPGVYGEPSKTISNVLSALVKAGRLQRLSRGTYARAGHAGPAGPGAPRIA